MFPIGSIYFHNFSLMHRNAMVNMFDAIIDIRYPFAPMLNTVRKIIFKIQVMAVVVIPAIVYVVI